MSRWRWLAWAGGVVACLVVVARAPIVTDIAAFLPGPATPAQQLLSEQLRDGVASRLMLVGIRTQRPEQAVRAAEVAQALVARLRADPLFAFVAAGQPADFERERERLFAARYLLSPQVDADAFGAAALRASFERLQTQLSSALAPLLRPLAPADPTGALLALLERLAQRPPPSTQHGVWFTADGRTAIVLAQTSAPGHDVEAQQLALHRLRTTFDALRGSETLQLQAAGPGVFAVESRAAIEGDAKRLSLLASVLIALLLLAALRSPRFLALAALPVASGAVAGLGVTALLFGEIHGITLGFGLTLVGEAVDYAIYVQVQRAANDDRRLWRALWLAVLTSAAGFVAMIFSGFRGLAQLGVFSLAGIVVAGSIARWYLPALLRPARITALPFDWPPQRRGLQRALQGLVAVAAIAAALVLLGGRSNLWNDSLAAISPLSSEAGALDAQLRGDAGLPQLRWLVALQAPTREQALQQAEALRPLLEQQRAAGLIGGFDSPADVLPSEATQMRRRSALPDTATLQAALDAALADSAFAPGAFAPFVADVARARNAPLVTAGTFAGTAIGQRLAAQLIEHGDGRAAALITLYDVDGARADELRRLLAARGATLLDLKGDVETLLAEYRQRALWAAAGGGLLIVALLVVQLRDVRVVLRITATLAGAVLLSTAALVWVQGALTLFHLVALLLVAGVGTNYALFFARLPAEPDRRRATLASVQLAAATTFVAFALLATSATPVLHMIGLTVAIGVIAAFAASAALAGPASAPPRRQ